MKAYCLVNVTFGHIDEVVEELKKIPNTAVVKVYGAYDVIVTLYKISPEEMKSDITWNIRRMKHVRSTLTLIGVDRSTVVEAS